MGVKNKINQSNQWQLFWRTVKSFFKWITFLLMQWHELGSLTYQKKMKASFSSCQSDCIAVSLSEKICSP